MAIKELDIAFNPQSIAIVGTSGDENSLTHSFLHHLKEYGYQGDIFPVTSEWNDILGYKCYSTLSDVPKQVEYVICCLPANQVVNLLKECNDKGVKIVHLFTGRFSETGENDATQLEQEVLRTAKKLAIRLIGPNCMGVYNPEKGIAFGFDFPLDAGRLGMFLQSGGASIEFIYYAALRGIRFSKMVSYGNALDMNESDYLEYFLNDEKSEIIATYIEGIKDGRKFLSTLKQVSLQKPVIILKAGRCGAGAKAVASHTASMAGSHQIWKAAIKQAGGIEAASLEDMLDLVCAFYFLPKITGNRVGILGGGGGKSVLSADEWSEGGFDVVPLPTDVRDHIRETMPKLWWDWIRNPIDLSLLPAGAIAANFIAKLMKLMSNSESLDLVVVNIPIGGPFSAEQFDFYVQMQVKDIIEMHQSAKNPILVVIDGGMLRADDFHDPRWKAIAKALPVFIDAGVPVYSDSLKAASSVKKLIEYYRWV